MFEYKIKYHNRFIIGFLNSREFTGIHKDRQKKQLIEMLDDANYILNQNPSSHTKDRIEEKIKIINAYAFENKINIREREQREFRIKKFSEKNKGLQLNFFNLI